MGDFFLSCCFSATSAVRSTIKTSRDHCIKLWDLRSGPLSPDAPVGGTIGARALTPTLPSGTEVSSIQGHVGSVTCVSVNDYRLLSGGGFNRG